jgi:hypothetical protein
MPSGLNMNSLQTSTCVKYETPYVKYETPYVKYDTLQVGRA